MPIISQPQENNQEELERQVENELRRLRINGNLDGFHFLAYAIAKTVREPTATSWITKNLYIEIAQRFQTTSSRVERSIRTTIQAAWIRGARETLDQIAGYHLIERPSNSTFIDLMAAYIRRKE